MGESSHIALRVASALVLLMGVAFTLFATLGRRQQRDLEAWAATHGTITRSDFVDDSEGGSLTIEYEYSVAGARHRSTRLAPTFLMRNAREMASKYPLGAAATVYYNPNNPQEAVLERGQPSFISVALILAGAVCFVIAALLFFLS